ncbi:OTU domain-containing protein [Cavenderia fasciculata]|uniref:OTU domain-containing protein n=1 Tax=Cavenderia fasciculata TaxID=261658 RepID=F4QFF3_CACFS|nr:OTU domain-containing protein [Cavenderia fasciculata]EGG14254.1 OTU domain-containing protein [Cavenderia fasciculata]|eukprot:XP_004350963.1 OTU domain-containing protein [Cavenderia fasciculata]
MGKKRNAGGNNNSNKQHDRAVKASLRKREHRLKHGDEKWKQSFNAFLQQLEPQGFYIKDVAGDGNCLFRAIADQLEDNPEQHMKYRQNIVRFIGSNKEMFAPFIDEDENETFEEYVEEMQRNASWGGNVEIQAASLIYQVNIAIHQMNQPRWEIINYVGAKFKMIHLSYHNDEHYASVRSLNLTPASLAKNAAPVPNMSATLNNDYTNSSSNGKSGKSNIDDTTFAIMNATGVTSVKLVKEALEDCQGNFEAAIDYLIALSSQIDLSNGGGSASDFDIDDDDNNTSTSTTSTSSTSSNSKPQKYKGKKKEKDDDDDDNSKKNAHLTNKQRKELAAKEKSGEGGNGNKKKRQTHNINRNDVEDDTKVELGVSFDCS